MLIQTFIWINIINTENEKHIFTHWRGMLYNVKTVARYLCTMDNTTSTKTFVLRTEVEGKSVVKAKRRDACSSSLSHSFSLFFLLRITRLRFFFLIFFFFVVMTFVPFARFVEEIWTLETFTNFDDLISPILFKNN